MAGSGGKPRVAVVGGGIGGLAAAYFLGRAGHRVEVFEAEEKAGGLAGSFDLGGIAAERYYHFLCLPDREIISLARQLGLGGEIEWRPTRTVFFHRGRLYGFTSALDLLRFSPIPLADRIRMGIESLKWFGREDWRDLDGIAAKDWLIERLGHRAYEEVWAPLLSMKFGEHHGKVSAAWIWHRVHRVARSRKTPLSPQVMGYFQGGTEMLLARLIEKIREQGGSLHLSSPVEAVTGAGDKVNGIMIGGEERRFDRLILAVPLPAAARLLPPAMSDYRRELERVDFLGVVCLVMQTSESISGSFWCNIHDDRIPFNGIIDTSMLNPATGKGGRLTYVPHYLPVTHPRFSYSDEQLRAEFVSALSLIRPDLGEKAIKSFRVFRSRHAQAVCPVGFAKMVPSQRAPLNGLYLIDSTQLYPSDRTLSGTIGLAENAAAMIGENS